jgi:hypothetical protein
LAPLIVQLSTGCQIYGNRAKSTPICLRSPDLSWRLSSPGSST